MSRTSYLYRWCRDSQRKMQNKIFDSETFRSVLSSGFIELYAARQLFNFRILSILVTSLGRLIPLLNHYAIVCSLHTITLYRFTTLFEVICARYYNWCTNKNCTPIVTPYQLVYLSNEYTLSEHCNELSRKNLQNLSEKFADVDSKH